ncbi:MAG TPA: VWA domain-containing protein [Thermoanaerobaculia bacterium]
MPAVSRSSLPLSFVLILLAGAALAAPPPIPEDLPARHKEFLETVAPLISAKEREAFLRLARDYQRDAFVRRFWEMRDPYPKTPRNEMRERWDERARIARERFGNLAEDRARMLLWNGPPVSVFQAHCADMLLPMEIWSYDGTDRLKGSFALVFVSRLGSMKGPWRLWYPSEGVSTLLSLEGQRLARQAKDLDGSSVLQHCPQGDDIVGRLGIAADWGWIEKNAPLAPKVNEEWLSAFLSRSTEIPEGAAAFPAQVDFSFPGRYGSRTVVQGLVSVPTREAKPDRVQDASAYSFVVDGEILYQGDLFDSFRYRFLFPEGEVSAETIPLVFQRYLRPGSYRLVLKVEDTGGKRYYREQRDLEIPSVQGVTAATAPATPAIPAPAPAEPAAGSAAPAPALAEANAAPFGSDEQTIRILAPPPGLVTGKIRLEAMATGAGIAKVSFQLNGKPVLTKSRPPYSVELNLGDTPRIHTLEAVALGPSGEKVAEDQILLNSGPHRFSIRLVEPQGGKIYRSSLRAQAQVDVPEGESLDRVELYLNDSLVATLFQPPFVQPIVLPPNAGLSYVRAVAYMPDGNLTEDLVVINAPGFIEEEEVDFVELFTAVVDNKGRPVEGLTEKDFTVLEDGQPQQVRRFELVRDLPIYAGILLDTSSSMGDGKGEKLQEAVKGALKFFEQVIQPKDRAAVFTFNDRPALAVRFTNQIDVLSNGLTGLSPEGNTALYDSVIYALYYFGGIKGKRAIILLSDGQDAGSHYSFNDALDYARRSGVAVYTVGIKLPPRDFDIRVKLQKLADETGGRPFFIDSARELERVFNEVETELRSQYLLAYQSPKGKDDDKFRAVEVKMSRPGLEARTIKGYLP